MAKMKKVSGKGDAGSYAHCPAGHRLPKHGPEGQCTPLWCAAGGKKGAKAVAAGDAMLPTQPKKRGRAAPSGADAPFADLGAAKQGAMAKIEGAMVRREVRREVLGGLPSELEGEEAETWTQRRIVGLLPDAVAEVEYQFKFGDDKQRLDAADRVLDMNGYRRREATGGAGQTIILNLGAGSLPWQQGAEKNEKVVAGEATRREAGELPPDGTQ